MNADRNESLDDYALLTVPDAAAERFRLALERRGIHAAVLTDDPAEREKWEARGVRAMFCPAAGDAGSALPEFPVCAVYLFEDTLRHTCGYLQYAADHTCAPVYVITHSAASSRLYRKLGASYVVCTHASDVSFLLPSADGLRAHHPFEPKEG
ncbi:hypothetical protein [Saccharibacillus alkalitolerans]|uniref:Uncharacterized protein n=1 Tax=Saccharibacillus alkalitolerans TaxID=2705290 RepID=A0ABX0FCJ2_9BACL|nr:hypothetical protein [Saccharibacillus alkalitolerans]NGZ77249.1 hypothetical protein [Saccharibacillus alkalitolerans]